MCLPFDSKSGADSTRKYIANSERGPLYVMRCPAYKEGVLFVERFSLWVTKTAGFSVFKVLACGTVDYLFKGTIKGTAHILF